MFRRKPELELLLGHPGGPLFARRDEGSWSILKGLIEDDADPLATAKREFFEETSFVVPDGARFFDLGTVKLKSGKLVYGFAFEGDCDPGCCKSNLFELEWPRGSGRIRSFPEIDRVAFFDCARAKRKLNPAQVPFVDRLQTLLAR